MRTAFFSESNGTDESMFILELGHSGIFEAFKLAEELFEAVTRSANPNSVDAKETIAINFLLDMISRSLFPFAEESS